MSEPAPDTPARMGRARSQDDRHRARSQGNERPQLAARSVAAWLRFGVPAVFGTALDLWTKHWAFPQPIDIASRVNGRFTMPRPAIPGFLTFETLVNRGGVFGQMQGWASFLAIFSWIAVVAIIYAFVRSRRRQVLVQIALGLIMAGALGNLYDRTIYGVVRDFMRFNVNWYPYVFNVADVMLCIGVPLLLLVWTVTPEAGKDGSGIPVDQTPS